jgi:hypothetical protein
LTLSSQYMSDIFCGTHPNNNASACPSIFDSTGT